MGSGERRPLDPDEYVDLLAAAFASSEYEEAGAQDEYIPGTISVTSVKKRSRSNFDTEEGVFWTLNDRLNTIAVGQKSATGRVVTLEKQRASGATCLRLWTPDIAPDHSVSVVNSSDSELPPDFKPEEEFVKGLRFLTEGDKPKG